MYLARHDANRLRATFGDAADLPPDRRARTRFVIAQDGPGDEISMSATYPQLLAVSERVIATCDPRLASLLRRSFPDVEFVPTYRQPSRPALGFLAPTVRRVRRQHVRPALGRSGEPSHPAPTVWCWDDR
jgi:hypothetical protein